MNHCAYNKSLRHLIWLCISVLGAFSLTACVSVNIGPTKAERSKSVQFEPPGKPFVALKDSKADKAWQSEATGSTISFLSECPEPEIDLHGLTTEFLAVFRAPKIIERNEGFYNGRESLETLAEGKLDGIPMRVSTTVFKRNGCSYLLTFVGRPERIANELEIYKQFLREFRAP